MCAVLGRPKLKIDDFGREADDKEPAMQPFDHSFRATAATAMTAPVRPRPAAVLVGLTGAQLSRLADLRVRA
jgi:hypothetical protein